MAKLARALVDAQGIQQPQKPQEEKGGDDQEKAQETLSVSPAMLKSVIGRNHSEFSSSRQQDAVEFFQHLLDQMSRTEKSSSSWFQAALLSDGSGDGGVESLFRFQFEDRFECLGSQRVMYKTRDDNVLALDIPVESASNIDHNVLKLLLLAYLDAYVPH